MRRTLAPLMLLTACSASLDPMAGPGTPDIVYPPLDHAPEASIELPSADDVHYVDVPTEFSGQVRDAEGAELTAWWESDRDGLLALGTAPDADGFMTGAATLSEGAHTISLHVDDGVTRTVATVEQVRVGPPNEAPSGEWLSPDGQVYARGESVFFWANVGDSHESADRLGVEWWSSVDDWIGESAPDASGRVELEVADLSVGKHEIRMVVFDELGASSVLATTVRIAAPPEVVIVAPIAHSSFPEGRTIVLVAMVQDDDGKAPDVIVGWTSQRDGKLGEGTPDDRGYAEVRAQDLSVGEHVLTVAVTDPEGLQTQQQITIVVE